MVYSADLKLSSLAHIDAFVGSAAAMKTAQTQKWTFGELCRRVDTVQPSWRGRRASTYRDTRQTGGETCQNRGYRLITYKSRDIQSLRMIILCSNVRHSSTNRGDTQLVHVVSRYSPLRQPPLSFRTRRIRTMACRQLAVRL